MLTLAREFESVIKDSIPFRNEELLNQLFEYVKKRLGLYLQKCTYFYAEKEYVDLNWRTIYSHHYSKTYYKECTPYCTRIHFFCSDNVLDDKDYYGYIVIRPLPTVFALGKIVLKAIGELYGSDTVYLMDQSHDITLNGDDGEIYEYRINAWTMLIQDAVAQVCADACLNMATCYLSKKYGNEFPHYSPVNLLPNNIDRRPIPSYGLTVYEMSQILVSNGYRAYMEYFHSVKERKRFIDIVDSNIESALPIILAYKGHVSIIAGYTKLNEKKYIIYDDSGYHLDAIGGVRYTEYTGIIDIDKISWGDDVFIIAFEYEKVFLRPDFLTYLMKIQQFAGLGLERFMLIEYKKLLKIIKEAGGEYTIYESRFPRYVWWVEGDGGSLVVDAASHKYDNTTNLLGVVQNINNPVVLLNQI